MQRATCAFGTDLELVAASRAGYLFGPTVTDLISHIGWVATVDCNANSHPAANAIDGNLPTFWTTNGAAYPHWLTIDFGQPQTFSGMQWWNRQDLYRDDAKDVEVYVSDDGVNWGVPIATATWLSGTAMKMLSFTEVTRRYVMVKGLNGATNAYMSCAEVNFGKWSNNAALKSAVTLPVGRFLMGKRASLIKVTSTAAGVPDWGTWQFCNGTVGTAYSHKWDLEGCSTPTTYTLVSGSLPNGLALNSIAGNQGSVSGTPTLAGTFTFTLRATNASGTADQAFSITIGAASGSSAPTVKAGQVFPTGRA